MSTLNLSNLLEEAKAALTKINSSIEEAKAAAKTATAEAKAALTSRINKLTKEAKNKEELIKTYSLSLAKAKTAEAKEAEAKAKEAEAEAEKKLHVAVNKKMTATAKEAKEAAEATAEAATEAAEAEEATAKATEATATAEAAEKVLTKAAEAEEAEAKAKEIAKADKAKAIAAKEEAEAEAKAKRKEAKAEAPAIKAKAKAKAIAKTEAEAKEIAKADKAKAEAKEAKAKEEAEEEAKADKAKADKAAEEATAKAIEEDKEEVINIEEDIKLAKALANTKAMVKRYDITTVKKLGIEATEAEKFLYNYLKKKSELFNNNSKYLLNCSELLKSVAFIFAKNKNKEFTVKNTFTTETIARAVVTLAAEKQCFLTLEASRKGAYILKKCANNLKDFREINGYTAKAEAKAKKTANTKAAKAKAKEEAEAAKEEILNAAIGRTATVPLEEMTKEDLLCSLRAIWNSNRQLKEKAELTEALIKIEK